MDFVLRKRGSFYCLDIKKKTFDADLMKKITFFIKDNIKNTHRLALNLKHVEEFDRGDTVSSICGCGVNLYGMNPILSMQLSLLSPKKFPPVYVSEDDFIQSKRMLARRRFRVV